ncbi:glycosyltransferase family 4 protein [Rhodovulum visakhapatnamense]|uniref:Glycosyltransferase involved in cell wall biosynthesis n=1 Tax=Rhodovulum visakhapatnamense TaxID=364297 RepID=A0A4R8F8T5_9RHOB|nr:glycosyltransferase family 4 protein [Rhodovulum visakhapatnamense]TDX21869.1 glycosyltransferase involved in cell wall biosynthesis [Rhodovulum visakhapatnamense]
MMRIGFLSVHNPYDRNSFSGTPYYMLRALEAQSGLEVRVLGRHSPPPTRLGGRLITRLESAVSGARRKDIGCEDIDDRGLHGIVAPVSSSLVAHLGDALTAPVLLLTDATPQFLREFYSKPIPPEADEAEARALSRAVRVIYSSDYMAARAQAEFPELAPSRIHVIPFGVNLDGLPETPPEKPPLDRLELLFIGQDWVRKGGDIALATLDALRDSGVAAHLTVIGATVPEALADPDTTVLGYLDKNDSTDAARLAEALSHAHVLILPTRADCTPMVVAEANAHGCPVLISDTGGIATLMDARGRNGRMLPPGADGAAYATILRGMTTDPAAYRQLSKSSFEHCRTRLTWDVWARDIVTVLQDITKLEHIP